VVGVYLILQHFSACLKNVALFQGLLRRLVHSQEQMGLLRPPSAGSQ